MRPKSSSAKKPAEQVVKDIRRATRRHFSAEDKIRIVLDGLRGDDSIAELCRKEGIAQSLYYVWSKEFMEAGKRRLAGDTARAATTDEVRVLRRGRAGSSRAPTASNAKAPRGWMQAGRGPIWPARCSPASRVAGARFAGPSPANGIGSPHHPPLPQSRARLRSSSRRSHKDQDCASAVARSTAMPAVRPWTTVDKRIVKATVAHSSYSLTSFTWCPA